LDTTSEGYLELNKKLCVIESIKCYIEHLSLFHKYELLLPPSLSDNLTDMDNSGGSALNVVRNKNYVNEMDVNLKIMHSRWVKRRSQEQADESSVETNKYPFTYMIDCIVEECRNYASTCSIFSLQPDPDNPNVLAYPPKSINVTSFFF
jgi:hypothetical protein